MKRDPVEWNRWRKYNQQVQLEFAGLVLTNRDLVGTNLSSVNLSGVNLDGSNLSRASFRNASLNGASLIETDLTEADLTQAHLREANLSGANLAKAAVVGCDFSGATLRRVDMTDADFTGADLSAADLEGTVLVGTNFTNANLSGCRVYGISAWNLKLDGTLQKDLVITRPDEPTITVDNIEVAQFLYLLLSNSKIRDVVDAISAKNVLILGRFTAERKAVLDALRDELRRHGYVPILFDFGVPARINITETISLLARMARFIIADLTDPSSIPSELEAIVSSLAVPVQPLIEGSSRPYTMFSDYWKYDWMLPVYRYEGFESLLASLAEKVIAPAEAKVKALQERRRMIEANLTRPQ